MFEIIICLLFVLFALPVFVLLLQTVFFWFSFILPNKNTASFDYCPDTVVLMPAHNEEVVIADTIRALQPHLNEHLRLLIVADNCSDKTVDIAQSFGVEVLPRFHDTNRGKGYALDYGINHLRQNPPEVVIIFDADCIAETGSLDYITKLAYSKNVPIQALYLMRSLTNKTKIAEFAWRIKNYFRPWGWHQIGGPCQLMGSGMAFPWISLANAELANGNIVEDMKLGIELTKQGFAPELCIKAKVTSTFPTSDTGIDSQRTRWEHGHLSTIQNEVPSLLKHSFCRLNWKTLLLGLDLLVPPLSLLVMFALVLVATGLVLGYVFSFSGLFNLALLVFSSFVIFFLSAWFWMGRDLIDGKIFFKLACYVFRKIPLYIKFVVNKQVEWVRSKRD